MSIGDALKFAPAVAALVTTFTGLYSLGATQRDRNLFKFSQDVLADDDHVEQHDYWEGEGRAALARLRARREVPARCIALPALLCYFLAGGYLLGSFWWDVSVTPSWKTWVWWPQFGTEIEMPGHIAILLVTPVTTGLAIHFLVRALDRRDEIAGRDRHHSRANVFRCAAAAVFCTLHTVGTLSSVPTPQSHDHPWPARIAAISFLAAFGFAGIAIRSHLNGRKPAEELGADRQAAPDSPAVARAADEKGDDDQLPIGDDHHAVTEARVDLR